MATSTTFDQADMLSYLLTKGPFTLVLCTNTPAGTETTSSIGRTDYPGYADKTILSTDFGSATQVNGVTQITNTANIVFATPTNNGTHTIGGFAFFDTNGNMRRYGALQTVLPIPVTGQPILIPFGQFIVAQG